MISMVVPLASKTAADVKTELRPQDAYILVVEDNLNNLALIVRLLNAVGVKGYSWKASGWHVLEHVRNLPHIDLILLDLRLPFEDGYEVLRKIRAERRLADARVVAVTIEATSAEMAKAQDAGFDGFLGKPLDIDRFPDQLRRILRGEEVWELH
jgi:two-component system cell cycle response regulator DivK